jgi:type IV pilus assembly protein PilA
MIALDHRKDAGFTLIEILVVLLILGVLAALALPSFIGQTESAKDAEAKSLARTLQTQVESCFVETREWGECDSAAELDKAQLAWGTDPGEVQVLVRPYGRDIVAFAATSQTGTLFGIVHGTDDRSTTRVCLVPSRRYPTGSCKPGGSLSAAGFGSW